MAIKKSIANYLGEDSAKTFVIPAYQRGFKWGVKNIQGESAASVLFRDIEKTRKSKKEEYFIQGITVYEDNNFEIVLIDGQQRTTFFFILLSLLFNDEEKNKYLKHKGKFKMKYEIREKSHEFLEELCLSKLTISPESQDTFYFEAVREQLLELLDEVTDKDELKNYLLFNVKLFYIVVDKEQATKLFSMMNGAKAFMKTDELIKADFLSKASKLEYNASEAPRSIKETFEILKDQIGEDWKSNALRSQFARQWDRWLYWWNQEEVKLFFRSNGNPLGLLLEFFYEQHYNKLEKNQRLKYQKAYSNKEADISVVFKSFQNLLIKDQSEAKENFEKLRKLQKQFEDLFSIPFVYNYLGLLLEITTSNDSKSGIDYFLKNYKNRDKIKIYTLLKIFNINIKDAENTDKKNEIENRIITVFKNIENKDVYNDLDDDDNKEFAFRLMLKLNVEAAIDKETKFEFFVVTKGKLGNIYKYRSLEHIWPKSKIAIKNENSDYVDLKDQKPVSQDNLDKYLLSEDLEIRGVSAHHIGNLVLLHKHDNSVFSNNLPEDKKKVYFDLNKELLSRNLMHTMSVFAYDSWSKVNAVETICANQEQVIKLMKKGYEDYVS